MSDKLSCRIPPDKVTNLHKLGDHLAALPEEYGHFRISAYARDAQGNSLEPSQLAPEAIHECGFAACGIGHGPLIGFTSRPGEDWPHYASRVFGARSLDFRGSDGGRLFDEVFAAKLAGNHQRLVERLDRWLARNEYPPRSTAAGVMP